MEPVGIDSEGRGHVSCGGPEGQGVQVPCQGSDGEQE